MTVPDRTLWHPPCGGWWPCSPSRNGCLGRSMLLRTCSSPCPLLQSPSTLHTLVPQVAVWQCLWLSPECRLLMSPLILPYAGL